MKKKNHTSGSSLSIQHGWRLSLISSLLVAIIFELVKEENNKVYMIIWYTALSLLLLNWLRTEVKLLIHRLSLPPGTLGYPLIGDIQALIDPVPSSLDKKKKYGNTYSQNLPIGNSVNFGNEQDITWLWNAERKGQVYSSWAPSITTLLGKNSLLNVNGKRHRALRRLLEPAFAPTAVREYLTAIDEITKSILKDWSNEEDMYHSSTKFKTFTLQVFFIAAFGDVDIRLIEQLESDFKIWSTGFSSIIPRRIPGSKFASAMSARDRILALIEDLIIKFKAENPPNSKRALCSMMGRVCYGVDENGNPIDMEDLKENILLMVFAGHDTTYSSIGTSLHYLREFPHIKEALINEVNSFREPLDFDEMRNAPILNAFMAEVWRMTPPAPGGFRKVKKTISYNGFTLPKDLILGYNIIVATQNEETYQSPTQFDIQRFLPEDHPLVTNPGLKARDVDYMKGNYPVFGGGMRACLGHNLAKLELRILLTRILQSYELDVQNSKKVTFPINGWQNEFKLNKK